MLVFRKIRRVSFSFCLRFEIRFFVLLPTICFICTLIWLMLDHGQISEMRPILRSNAY